MSLQSIYICSLLSAVMGTRFLTTSLTILLSLCSIGLAYHLGYISPLGLGMLALTAAGFFAYYEFSPFLPSKFFRIGMGLLLIGLIFTYYAHIIPGFRNFVFIDAIKFSPDAAVYRKYINLDKVMLAIIIILASGTLLKSKNNWTYIFSNVLYYLIPTVLVLLGGLYLTNYAHFSLKWSPIFWTWLPLNLLLVCFSEEVVLRGFLLKEMEKWFNNKYCALILSSLFFGALHYSGGPVLMGLATVASLFYGHIYQKTNCLEASILLHFLINAIHIIFFTYPYLVH